MRSCLAGLIALLLATPLDREDRTERCQALAALAVTGARLTSVQSVAAGGFAPPSGADAGAAFRALPAFCRVAATLTPSSDSDIRIEVWLPEDGWNRKIQAVGNGAFNGNINYPGMAAALARGYATASTDTGHAGGGAAWAIGHPEKVVDFGWRAVHEMAVAARRIVTGFYESAPAHAYWSGCSAGGRQAMMEAQRFPADFDGIVAGSPGLDWTSRATAAVDIAKGLESNEAARLSQADRQLLHGTVLEACDALDGVKDGLIENPLRCRFDPEVLLCKAAGATGCLTRGQIGTAARIYAAGVNPETGRPIGGLAHGSELGWTDLGWTASARATGLDQFRYLVFADPAWTIQRFDFATNVVRAEKVDAGTINALDPNLRPFLDRGGKLIQYHGWSDPQISPLNSVQYYSRVLEALGDTPDVRGGYRLFMAPGMGHCGGGEGPNSFDMVGVLERWVEQGQAPDVIVATHSTSGRVDRTRPLCPYPQVAVYRGTGNADDAASFSCKAQ